MLELTCIFETTGLLTFDGPFDEHSFKGWTADRLGKIVIHACFLTFLFIALNGRGCHCYDWDGPYAIDSGVRFMVSDEVCCSIAV